MATLNRILMGLIVILAIGAAILSYLLFERRNDFRDRAAMLGDTVARMVQHLDERSGRGLSRQVSLTPQDTVANVPEGGSLSWQSYAEDRSGYQRLLEQAQNLAADIARQRDFLAEQMTAVGSKMGFDSDNLSIDMLRNATDPERYKAAAQKVDRLAQAVQKRSDDMIRAIVNVSNVIGVPVDERELRERSEQINQRGETVYGDFKHGSDVDKFERAVTNLNNRANDYAQAMTDAINRVTAYNWETRASRVADKNDYNLALTSMQNDFSNINKELIKVAQIEAQLAKTQDELRQVSSNLENVSRERDQLSRNVSDLQARVRKYETGGARAVADAATAEMNPNLQGRILLVNDQWKFVILDLGRQDVRENVELLVARDEKLVARLLVTKVAPNVSVAEIIPEGSPGTVQVNDRVILPTRM